MAEQETKAEMPWEKSWIMKKVQPLVDAVADAKNGTMPWERQWKERATQPSLKTLDPVKSAPVMSKEDYFSTLAKVESGGNAKASASTSSAVGLYQFTEGTWSDMTKKMGVSYSLADRTDPKKSRHVVEAFTAKNEAKATRDLGRAPENHELYMYHLLGSAKDILTAPLTEPAADYVQAQQARANKNVFFTEDGKPRSVKEVLTMFKRKFQ